MSSKHSNYQLLPSRLKILLNEKEIQTNSRYEKERLNFIIQHLDIYERSILDIGGNSGFFTFELIENGAKRVDYYEGNSIHAKFVEIALQLLKLEDKVITYNRYFNFENSIPNQYD